MDRVLVTGAAGFIGFHLAGRLLDNGVEVVGLDDLNDYYDVALKEARLAQLQDRPGFRFVKMGLHDRPAIEALFAQESFDVVVNLAGQVGVRYSLENPHAYVDSNLVGFVNVLEGCRRQGVGHLVFASSSSVYGANTAIPYSVHQNVDHPISLYAATKKANELMAHSYAELYRLPVTGLRFFTVYGPWGRPDMAPLIFTRAILEERPIDVFNHGRMMRDFTYIDDIVEAVWRVCRRIPVPSPHWSGQKPDPASSKAPYRIYNIGNGSPVALMDFIRAIERATGKQARLNFMPHQPGDMISTHADVTELEKDIDFRPATSVADGVARLVAWYQAYQASIRKAAHVPR